MSTSPPTHWRRWADSPPHLAHRPRRSPRVHDPVRAAGLRDLLVTLGLEGTERLYLLADVPVLLVAGSRDSVIPVAHTVGAHDLLQGSHLEIFDGAGHFPHDEQPVRFADLLMRFLTSTTAAHSDLQALRRRLRSSPDLAVG